jgi:hypothetical protein
MFGRLVEASVRDFEDTLVEIENEYIKVSDI